MLSVGSLFSGIGGMDAGLHRAGFNHAFFAEVDPWRREVLAARWPGVPIYDDVRDVGQGAEGARPGGLRAVGEERRDEHARGEGRHSGEHVDLLCGGFPCQDLSVAGKRAGLDGARSGLFFEFARIIDALRPRWVLVENVPGLLSSNGGRDFGVVLGTLADLGYGVGWRILDSRFFGVPQRRRRVFIVGAVADGDPRAAAGRAGEVLAVGARCPGHPPTGTQEGEGTPAASVVSTLQGGGGSPRGHRNDAEGAAGGHLIPVSFHPTGGGAKGLSVGELAPGVGFGNGGQPAIAFDTYNQSVSDTVQTLRDPNGTFGDALPAVAYHFRTREDGSCFEETEVNVSRASVGGSGGAKIALHVGTGVRRLTPRECERLQGLPDDWTRLDAKTPDSRRYSALGDAVTANVAEWLGRRILEWEEGIAA